MTVVAAVAAVAALVASIMRYRPARGAERAQLKWLLAAGGLALVAGAAEARWSLPGAWLVGASAVRVGVGVAVLRYRLYDQLLRPQGGESQLAVAGSTLAVAGLFQPARGRIQQAVDRRFNRRPHDALATVQAFGVRLRDQFDLDSLTVEVVGVVQRTMEPTQVSLSLCGAGTRHG